MGTSKLLGQPRSCEVEGRVKSEEVRVDDLYWRYSLQLLPCI